MGGRCGVRGLLAVVVVVAGVMAGGSVRPTPAGASCAGPRSVDEAFDEALGGGEPVFVGTVVSTRNPWSPPQGTPTEGDWATFAVEEIWAGDVPDEVEVKGGPQHDLGNGRFQSMSDTRSFLPGARYLVFPYLSPRDGSARDGAEPGGLNDNGCSATREWTDDLASFRPADARIIEQAAPVEILGAFSGPSPDDGVGSWPWPWIGVVSIFVVIVGGGALLAWRSGRKPDEPVDDEAIEDLIDHDRHRAGLD